MLISSFLSHQFKKARRSSIWQKNKALNILIFIVALIVLAEVIGFSLILAHGWHELFPEAETLSSFIKISAYYFLGSFALRFFMQQLPTIEIIHYQLLPIKKSTLIHFILIKGKINFFVLLSLIVFAPFAFMQVAYYEGNNAAWLWLIGMMLIDLTVNNFIFYLKRQLVNNLKTVTTILVLLGLTVTGDVLKWYSFSDLFAQLIVAAIRHPLLWLVPLSMLAVSYLINYRFLYARLYLEEISTKKSVLLHENRFGYLQRFGLIGEIMLLDIKLYMRNKRTKSMLYLTPIFWAYGLLFYPSDQYTSDSGFMIFIGIFISGYLTITYLQSAFAYEGSYYDFLLSLGIDFEQYIKAKLTLGSFAIVVSYFITLPYLYFGWRILLINTATAIFNLGFVTPMMLYFATYNKKAIQLSRGNAFNFQGMSAVHWLTMLPVFVLPTLIYLPFKWFGHPDYGLLALAAIGLITIAFRSFLIKFIRQNLLEKKYIMATGFREKN
ncbi:MAG: DUF5687 family protein [Bacteroidales bacterium]|jgi:hypothetical protein|nr:DUF5687 family protein [Bacteroidales bacterium]